MNVKKTNNREKTNKRAIWKTTLEELHMLHEETEREKVEKCL